MKTFELKGTKRTETGKKATRELRKQNIIPCVIYGSERDAEGKVVTTEFQVPFEAVRKLIYTPEIYAVNLDIDGNVCQAVMREIQFHPVKDNVLHIDFYQVAPGQAIHMAVPVKFEGHAEGVRAGGVLFTSVRYLTVKAPLDKIPEKLIIYVTPLTIGKTFLVGDLKFEDLEFVTSANTLVCGVKSTRGSQAQAAAVEETTEEAESAPAE